MFVGRSDGTSQLYRRELGGPEEPEPISWTEGVTYAFFSPDGESLGFLTADRVNRVSLSGDQLQTLAATRGGIRATWEDNGWIYVHESEGSGLDRRVPADGGDVESFALLSGMMSDLLPDGRHVLATQPTQSIHGDHANIVTVNLDTGEVEPVPLTGFDPVRSINPNALSLSDFGVVAGRPGPPIRCRGY